MHIFIFHIFLTYFANFSFFELCLKNVNLFFVSFELN